MYYAATFVALLLATLCYSEITEKDVSSLSEQERLLNQKIEQHLVQVNRQIKALDTFLERTYKDYNYTEEDAHEYVSNPINTYMLIKRTSLEWPNIKKVLFNETAEREFKEIQEMMKELPTNKDEL